MTEVQRGESESGVVCLDFLRDNKGVVKYFGAPDAKKRREQCGKASENMGFQLSSWALLFSLPLSTFSRFVRVFRSFIHYYFIYYYYG